MLFSYIHLVKLGWTCSIPIFYYTAFMKINLELPVTLNILSLYLHDLTVSPIQQ